MFEAFWNGNRNWRRKHGEPRNRRELFICVTSDNFFSLIFLNFFYGLFFLPAVLWSIACALQSWALFQSGDMTATLNGITTLLLGLIPCITLTGPARAGMAFVMRKWAQERTCTPIPAFWDGLKKNWKQSLLPAAITSAFPLILWNAYRVSAEGAHEGPFFVLLVLAGIGFFIWLLAQQILYVLLVTYDLPLRGHIRNALLLTIMKLPQAVLVFLASAVPLLIYALFAAIRPKMLLALLIIPCFYYFFIGWCLTDLLYASYANWLCDTYLTRE